MRERTDHEKQLVSLLEKAEAERDALQQRCEPKAPNTGVKARETSP